MHTKLIAGYQHFKTHFFKEKQKLYKSLAQGQQPICMVISCADSRVDPATIFNTKPGELFVIRNVANLIPPAHQTGQFHGTAAAIEFGINMLNIEEVIVLGHGGCGGISACLDLEHTHRQTDHIHRWVQLAEPAVELARQQQDPTMALQEAAEKHSVAMSVERLGQYACVKKALNERSLVLSGAWFSIESGELQCYQANEQRFVSVPT